MTKDSTEFKNENHTSSGGGATFLEQLQNEPLDLLNLYGLIETVTTAPTAAPTKLFDQVKLYTDSLASPTVYKVYFYITKLNVWKSVSLS